MTPTANFCQYLSPLETLEERRLIHMAITKYAVGGKRAVLDWLYEVGQHDEAWAHEFYRQNMAEIEQRPPADLKMY